MEKKTIGQFIAALRKANGMTQKELAEKLNVSDKAVSRWERDESAPDLSLIPVIAEIFGVTSDEILRGERAAYQENSSIKSSEKGKKQIAMLLDKAGNKFKMFCLITMGIAGIGLISALICNFGIYRARLGFFIGTIFYIVAGVVLGIALLHSLQAIQMEEADEEQTTNCKNQIIRWCYFTALGIVDVFLLTLPFVTHTYDAFVGIDADMWLGAGVPNAGIGFVVGLVFWWIISGKKFATTEEQKGSTKRKLKYVGAVTIALVVTMLIQAVTINMIYELHPFTEGKTFYHYEEFIEYMEQDIAVEDSIYGDSSGSQFHENIEDEEVYHKYYDENGNEITLAEYERLYRTEKVYDKKGELLFTYIRRNESVFAIKYGGIPYDEGEDMPITVYTNQDIRHENVVIDDLINPLFMLVYISEIVVAIVLYFRRKKKA